MTNSYYHFARRYIPSDCLQQSKDENVLSLSKKLFACSDHEFKTSTAALLQGLFQLYAERVVLLDDAISDQANTLVSLGDHAYRVSASSVTKDLRDMLTLGGWVMMFANQEINKVEHDGSDWSDPAVLQETLIKNSLGCIISSWFDDNEWLVVFSPEIRGI